MAQRVQYPWKFPTHEDDDEYILVIYVQLEDKQDLIEIQYSTFLDFLSSIGGFLSIMYEIGAFFASFFS